MHSLWMIFASFCFACMGVCVKLASQTFATAEIVFYRAAISLLFMLAILWFRAIPLSTPHWKVHLSRSFCGFFSLLSYFFALSLLPLATAVTLSYTSPLFLALYLAWFGRVPLRLSVVGALLVGLTGVVLLLQPTFRAEQLTGGLFGLAAGMLSGLAYYNVRELGTLGETEERTVFYFSLFSTVASGIFMLPYHFQPVDFQNGLLLLGVGGFATVAQLAMTRAYKRGNPLVAASLAYSTVVFASVMGVCLWDETLSSSAIVAILLIVASGIIASLSSRANPAEQD